MRRTATALLALSAVLGLAGCGSSDVNPDAAGEGSSSMTSTSSATPTGSSPTSAGPSGASPTADAMASGAYLTLAEYKSQMGSRESSKVVYFFHASWCPDCRATEKSLSDDGVPTGLTVVKVDYDKETDLKKKYGVTVQHTFVQIAPDGEQLAKWSGSTSGAAIKSKTV